MGVERDRREQERKGNDQHDDEQHEGVRGLGVRKGSGERERGDSQAAAQRDESEVGGRGLDRAVAMDLESERSDRHEKAEHEKAEDRERRREYQHAEGCRANRKRGGEEVIGGLVEPDAENQRDKRGEDDARCEPAQPAGAKLEIEDRSRRVERAEQDEHEGSRYGDERERTDEVQMLSERERPACRDREHERRRRDRQFSRTTRSFTIRNPPASAMTTSTQPSKSDSPSCGTVRSRTRSSTPVIMRIAPRDPRTGV